MAGYVLARRFMIGAARLDCRAPSALAMTDRKVIAS
jgi:hypothetical protein